VACGGVWGGCAAALVFDHKINRARVRARALARLILILKAGKGTGTHTGTFFYFRSCVRGSRRSPAT